VLYIIKFISTAFSAWSENGTFKNNLRVLRAEDLKICEAKEEKVTENWRKLKMRRCIICSLFFTKCYLGDKD
jgi:hypothetical protein